MRHHPVRQLENDSLERTLEKMVGESRAAVLRALEGGRRSVGDIVEETRLSQPNVSNHLGRLRELGLVESKREGRRIFYGIVSPDLVRALLGTPGGERLTGEESVQMADELAPVFEQAILNLDDEAAHAIVDRALADGLPWQDLYTRVFMPALVHVGDQWAGGALSVDHEHACSQMIERLMGHVAAVRVPARKSGVCDVVVACSEGERHEIGARMAADFLSADGMNVVFLGADTPNDAILAATGRLKPSVVIVAAATGDRAASIRALRGQWSNALSNGNSPLLMIAGRLVHDRPELCEELGVPAAPADPVELCRAVRTALG